MIRVEAALLFYPFDMNEANTPWELGLGFAVSKNKEADFRGKAEVLASENDLKIRTYGIEADANEAAVWSRPKDWQFDPTDPRRGLGGLRNGRFLALFADGSVRTINLDGVSYNTTRALFCRNDGEVVEIPTSR